MSFTRLKKYDFAVSQSISGSFTIGDTVEASFLAKANNVNVNSHTTQFVDLKYSVLSESIDLKEFPKGTFPERFYIGNSYVTKSFVAGIPEEIQYVQFTLTGSINSTGSHTYSSGGLSYANDLQLDYDAFQIKVHRPKTELKDTGLLVFTSPSKYIKADSDGVEIKGGQIQADKLTVETLEVFGDAAIFGDVTATANSPYTSTPNLVGLSGSQGSVATFARGDHQHALPFSTINTLAQQNEFTKISGSKTSTGSFGEIEVHIGGTANNSLTISDVSTGIGRPNLSSENTIFIQQGTSNQTQFGGDVIPTSTNTKDLGSAGRQWAEFHAVSSSVSHSIVSSKVGIGTLFPPKPLTVEGDISASGHFFLGHDKFLYNNLGDTALIGEFSGLVYIGSINHKTLFQGNKSNGIQFGQNTSIPLVMEGQVTASGEISASGIITSPNILAITTTTGSLLSSIDSISTTTGSLLTSIDTISSITSSLFATTGSLLASIDTISTTTGSLLASIDTISTTTGSLLTSIDTISTTTGSLLTSIDTISTTTGSLLNSVDSISTTTGSLLSSVDSISATTGSLLNSIDEISLTTGSLLNSIASISTVTGSYAITGSDVTFGNVTLGEITASGNVKIDGDISSSGTLRISTIRDANDEGSSSDLSVDAANLLNIGSSQADEINIGRQDNTSVDINLYAGSSTPSIRMINKGIKINHPITASSNISSSANIETLHTGSFGKGFFKGRVGIGVTNPNTELEIYSANSEAYHYPLVLRNPYNSETNLDYGVGIKFHLDDANDNKFGSIAYEAQTSYANIGNLKFYVDQNDTTTPIATMTTTGLGIGTTTPSAKLTIEGDVAISASGDIDIANEKRIRFAASDGTYSDDGSIRRASGEAIRFRYDKNAFIFDAIENDNWEIRNSGDSPVFRVNTNNGTSIFSGSAGQFFSLEHNTGHIGIGVSNPTAPLHVENDGSVSNLLAYFKSGDQAAKLRLEDDDTMAYFNVLDDTIRFNFSSDASHAGLTIKSGSTTAVNVGIGTTSPDYALDVVGDVGIDKFIYHNGDDDTFFKFQDAEDNIQLSAGGSHLNFTSTGLGVGVTATEKFDVDGNIKARGNISSPTFFSGFAGNGFRVTSGSKYSLEVDDLTVRNSMSVFELLIHQVRATNGSLFVSNTGKIISASKTSNYSEDHREFNLFFDTGSNYGHSFLVGDLIRAQRFQPSTNGSGSQVFKSDFHIIGVNGTTSSLARLTGSDEPEIGYEYVRIGSTTNTDRQGSIYMTADDENAPFLDVVDELTAHSQFNTAGKTKVRLGKLSGITTTTFGTLPGYGFYASGSAYLEGSINATAGEIGGFGINKSTISSSNGNLKLFSDGVISGSDVHFNGGTIGGFTIDSDEIKAGSTLVLDSDTNSGEIKLGGASDITTGDGIYMAGDKKFRVGQASDNFIRFNNTANKLEIKTPSLTLDSSGNLTTIGTISSSAGNIGGWTIDTDKLAKSNLFELAPNATYVISSSNFKVSNAGSIIATAGTIGGFGLGATTISSSTGTLILTNTGQITASDADITGKINATSGQFSGDVIATHINTDSGSIGGFTIDGHSLTTDGVEINKTGQSLFISSSDFKVSHTGELTASNVRADGGTIGGFAIDESTLKSTGNNIIIDAVSNDGKITIGNIGFGQKGIQLDNNNGHPKFYVGDGGTTMGSDNFISFTSQNGLLDVSSPTFQLDASEGTAFLSGSISASAGEIGGFSLGINKISSKNLILSSSTDTNEFIISASNFNVKAGGQITASNIRTDGGTVGGFTIDETSISSNGLTLKSNGQLTGSAVSMSGTIVTDDISATGGTIGGFTLDTNLKAGNDGAGGSAIDINPSTPSIKLGAKESIADNDGDTGAFLTDQAIAIGPQSATQGFRVTSQGVVTASNALIRGNSQVAGFDVSDSQISSQAGTLVLKSSGQITASAVSMSGHIIADSGIVGGFSIDNNEISSSGILIQPYAGSAVTPSIELGGKSQALSSNPGVFIGKNVFFGAGYGIAIGDTNVISGTEPGGFVAATGTDSDDNVVAFGQIKSAYAEAVGNTSYVMYRPTSGLLIQHPNFSLRDGQLQISASGNKPTNIKLASDGISTGIEIGNKTGIVGHGDVTSHAFQTHDGNFQFGEDTISVPGGGGGAQYGTDGTLTKGGENQYNPSGD